MKTYIDDIARLARYELTRRMAPEAEQSLWKAGYDAGTPAFDRLCELAAGMDTTLTEEDVGYAASKLADLDGVR